MATLLSRFFGQGSKINNDQIEAMVQAQVDFWLKQNNYIPSITPIYPNISQAEAVKEGYCGNSDVFSIISRKAQMAASIPFYEYQIKGEEGKKHLRNYKALMSGNEITEEGLYKAAIEKRKAMEQVSDGSALNKLLLNPNEEESQQEFLEKIYGFLDTTGNAFIYKERLTMGANEGKVKWLSVQPSPYMKIIPDGKFPLGVAGYIMTLWGDVGIEKENMVHVKYFNPDYAPNGSHLYGLSPLQAGKKTFTRSNSEEDSAVAQFQHGGPAGMVYNESIAPTEQNMQQVGLLKKRWEQETQGNKNRGKVLFSAGKLGYIQSGLSPADLKLLESEMFTFRRLCRVYKVQSAIFNDNEHATLNNMKEFYKMSYVDGILPMVIKVRDSFNRSLLPDFNKSGNTFIDADFTNVSALQQDMKTLSEWLEKSPEITLNERREMKMQERLPDPKMDKIYVPGSWRSLDDLNMEPVDNMDEEIDEMNKSGLNPYN